jgi:hypothetical protein
MSTHSPPKGKRGCYTALKPDDAAEYATCPHNATVTQQMPPGSVHFAQAKCVNCGQHIRWLPRPENIERRRLDGFRLARLAMCNGLTSWERNFIRDLSQRKKLSPRQKAIIDELCGKHLKGATV